MVKRKPLTVRLLFCIGIVTILISNLYIPKTVFANSAPPTKSDDGTGIMFKQHDTVKIESEILNIKVNDDATADISATYVMKNTSQESLNIETMFISPVMYGENKEITIQRNQVDLPFVQEFYSFYMYYKQDLTIDFENWENVLNASRTHNMPLGDGTGFWEYRYEASDDIYTTTVKFLPESVYFCETQFLRYFDDQYVQLENYRNYDNTLDDVLIVSSQDITAETNGNLIKTEILDIYEYLYNKAVLNASDEQLRFVDQQFNMYLNSINPEYFLNYFFTLTYIDQYLSAISYNIDFAPDEELTITVSYNYQMGTSSYRNTASLLYYLTPAKYWKDFANIEINLTLSEKYKKLQTSSVDFKKIDGKNFKFVSTTLPKSELNITVNDGSVNIIVVVFIVILAFVGIILFAVVIAISIAIYKIAKKPVFY